MDSGSCVVSTPPRQQVLDVLVEAVVEPVVDEKVSPEVPDKAAMLGRTWPERLLDALPRLAEPDASDRIAEPDQPPPGLHGSRPPAKGGHCGSHLVEDVRP